jgi:hypothetical protein
MRARGLALRVAANVLPGLDDAGGSMDAEVARIFLRQARKI